MRLIRLSLGFRKQTCRVGLRKLIQVTDISQKTVARSIDGLIEKKLIQVEDRNNNSKPTLFRMMFSLHDQGVASETTPNAEGIDSQTTPNAESVGSHTTDDADGIGADPMGVGSHPTGGVGAEGEWGVGADPTININIKNKTTNNKPDGSGGGILGLVETDLSEIEVQPLEQFGLTADHLKPFLGRFTVDEVNSSIDAFAFDLQHNNKKREIKGSPLNFFFGILRNGPYIPPENYMSPTDRRRREIILQKQRQREETKRLEQEEFNAAFEEWFALQSPEFIKQIAPSFAKSSPTLCRGNAANHFRVTVWEKQNLGVKGGETSHIPTV